VLSMTRKMMVITVAAGVALIALARPSAAFDGSHSLALTPAPAAPALQLGFGFTEAGSAPLVLHPAERIPLQFSARTDRERKKWVAPTLAAIGLALIVPNNDNSLETLFFAAATVGVVMYMDAPRPDAPLGLPQEGMAFSIREMAPNLGYQMRW